jgi:hypothetical protein
MSPLALLLAVLLVGCTAREPEPTRPRDPIVAVSAEPMQVAPEPVASAPPSDAGVTDAASGRAAREKAPRDPRISLQKAQLRDVGRPGAALAELGKLGQGDTAFESLDDVPPPRPSSWEEPESVKEVLAICRAFSAEVKDPAQRTCGELAGWIGRLSRPWGRVSNAGEFAHATEAAIDACFDRMIAKHQQRCEPDAEFQAALTRFMAATFR